MKQVVVKLDEDDYIAIKRDKDGWLLVRPAEWFDLLVLNQFDAKTARRLKWRRKMAWKKVKAVKDLGKST
jgi:hypothetical protein